MDIKVNIDNYGVSLPLNTYYIGDKSMNFETLALITLYSNYKGITICDLEELDCSEAEHHRYLYEKGDNSLYSNMADMEKLSKNKRRNIKRDIKKLTECNNKVVEICKDKDGNIYYKINPYANDEEGTKMKGFVTIDSRMLQYLIHVGNSNVIKTYCAIKILLWDNKEKCYIQRVLTRDFLLKFIGLSNCEKNLQQMTDILKSLIANGFIKRERYIHQDTINGEIITKDTYKYELMTTQQWLDFYKKL